MEYRDEFETRKDVFRVNVFHNKKNGEKVTMYFIPRSTPVNEDTVFDYCTKNKTWREKQAQQWCDEKSGKNKDKLKSLPFVAGGLQRDLKWFGDKATALFDDYKKGLGMTVHPRNNNQTGEKKGSLADKIKAFDWAYSPEVSKKFNELFHIPEDAWKQTVVPNGGSSIVTRTLTYKGKKYSGTGSDKKSATKSTILDFLEKEYGVTAKTDLARQKAEAEKRKDEARQAELLYKTKYLRVLSERPDVTVKPTSWINLERPAKGPRIPANSFLIETPYGKQELTDSDISMSTIKSITVTAAEREEYNQRIETDKKDLIEHLEYEREEERRYEAWKKLQIEEERKAAEEEVKAKEKRRQENGGLNAKLEDAVKANDLDEVKSLIAAGAQISNAWDKKEDFENTLLLALDAVDINQDMVNFLMDNGAKTEFEVYDYDGDLSTTRSLLCSKIEDLDVDAVRALVIGGADIWFEPRGYGGGVSVDAAIAEIRDSHDEEGYYGYKEAMEIQEIIEDARDGILEIHEADKTDQQTQEISETKDVIKEEENVGTPLSIVSDDKGMVHLAPRENLKQSAIFSMSLFGNKGEEIPIKVALVSDRVPLQSNTKLSQEDMITHADAIDNSVFLVSYSKAKEIVGEMERHGKTADASQARIRINLFKNMGEKSPIEKTYDGSKFIPLIANSGKGMGK